MKNTYNKKILVTGGAGFLGSFLCERLIDENNYVIEMALAGFGKTDLEIELTNGELTIKSKKKDGSDKNHNLIHQGISQRSFMRKFTLSDEILVKNAEMKDGMLTIKLERLIPESKKSKIISIPITIKKMVMIHFKFSFVRVAAYFAPITAPKIIPTDKGTTRGHSTLLFL